LATEGQGLVLFERRNGYGLITLNRPEKRNAMNRAAQLEFLAALEEAKADCPVVVITGAGDKSFCAGVDLTESPALSAGPPPRVTAVDGNPWFRVMEEIKRHPAVFIAAVNGYAIGGGLTLVHTCQLAIAAETATFAAPEVSLGIYPGLAGPATVKRLLPKHYSYMVLTGRRINAASALQWGIVNEVVAPGDLMGAANQLASHIAAFDPTLLDHVKKSIWQIPELPWSQAIDYGIMTGAVVRGLTSAGTAGVGRFVGKGAVAKAEAGTGEAGKGVA
jgi:enoyl-CoA hydratase/carnithine racemase